MVPPSRAEFRSNLTVLHTNSVHASSRPGMHTTTAGPLSSSIFRYIQKILRFHKIIENPGFFWIFLSGGDSTLPLPLVFVSRDTWTTPGTTLARWYESPSATMISESSLSRKTLGQVSDPSKGDECGGMSHSTALLLHTDRLLLVLERLV